MGDRVVEAVASDCAAEGAKDVAGIVVGPLDVGGLAVASERDRARSGPWTKVRAGLREVGVWGEPERVGVLRGSEHELARELDRGRDRGAS